MMPVSGKVQRSRRVPLWFMPQKCSHPAPHISAKYSRKRGKFSLMCGS